MLSRVRLFVTPWTAACQPPCPSSSPGTCSNSVHWISDAIQPSHPVIPFSSCLQSFPASGSFPMSQIFASGGQSIGVSGSASVLPMHIQDWCPLVLTGLILQSKGLSSLLQHHSSKASILQRSAFFTIQLSHPYMTTGFSSFDHEYETMNRRLLNGTVLHSYFLKNMDQNSHPIKTQIFGTKYFVSINSPTFS